MLREIDSRWSYFYFVKYVNNNKYYYLLKRCCLFGGNIDNLR